MQRTRIPHSNHSSRERRNASPKSENMRKGKPRLAESLFKESCFGEYVFSPTKMKSFIITNATKEVVKEIRNRETVEEIKTHLARNRKTNANQVRKAVDNAVDLLVNLGVLRFE